MLNLKKDEKKGRCPFRNLKPCDSSCVFFRKGVRFNEKKSESFPFEECAINIIADNLEAMHNRTYMMQREVGEMKNAVAFNILSDLGLVTKEQAANSAQAIINMPDDKKLIK